MSPIYDLKYPKCGASFEKIMSIHDPMPLCPSCHESQVEKMPPVRTSWQFGGLES